MTDRHDLLSNGSSEVQGLHRAGVLAAGLFIVDAVKTIDRWPEESALALIRSQSPANGGGAYNVLHNVGRLIPGHPRWAAGCIGDDELGEWIAADCLAAGIETGLLRTHATLGTSYTDVMSVAGAGSRTFFHSPGANVGFAPESAELTSVPAAVFYLGYLGLLPALDTLVGDQTAASRLLRDASRAGMVAVVDCVSVDRPDFAALALPSLRAADVFFCNEFEAGQILRRVVPCRWDAMQVAAEKLQQLSGATVVVHTAIGAVHADELGVVIQPSVRVPIEQIVGTNGAGDAFSAGYIVALEQEHPPATRLQWGVAAAAASLADATPSAGVRPIAECLAMAERFGFVDLPL